MISIETKRAITYGILAHINNTKRLSNGQLDLFVPIVKKAMSKMTDIDELKGENVSEIGNSVISQFITEPQSFSTTSTSLIFVEKEMLNLVLCPF